MKRRFLLIILIPAFLFTSCVSSDLFVDAVFDKLEEKRNSPEAEARREAAIDNAFNSIEKATEEITPEQEYYIGRTVANSILSKYNYYSDNPKLTAYLNSICNAITLNSEIPYLYKGYYVGILDSDEINAMATPGGHILITRGLINCTDSEDALAAVLAHEIGHIQLKHSITAIKSSRATNAIMTTASAAVTSATAGIDDNIDKLTDGLNDAASEIVNSLVETGFSKAQEFAADNKALELMASAGYDPYCMLDMLALIKLNSESNQGGFSKTHPSPDLRIENVNKSLKKKNYRISEKDRELRTKRFNSISKN